MLKDSLKRSLASSTRGMGKIGIRREDALIYERRCPLIPSHVGELVKQGHEVIVEPASKRAFSDIEFEKEGAKINSDLSDCDVILGVKQIPIESLVDNSTSVFFSHTIKAQPDNMPMLDACLERNVTIVDYECISDADGNRLVAFGHWAGIAGAINGISLMGMRLLAFGHNTPLIRVNMASGYRTSVEAMDIIRQCGDEIRSGVLSSTLDPFVFIVTGKGRCAHGAKLVLDALGVEWVTPNELENLPTDNKTMYACMVGTSDHLFHPTKPEMSYPEGGTAAWDYFLKNNTEYESSFASKIAPHASMIINCLYWAPGDPRILTNQQLDNLLEVETRKPTQIGVPYLPQKLLVISDVSADSEGSLEFMKTCTSVERPFEIIYPSQKEVKDCILTPGVVLTSIDYLPALLPREASAHFGDCLMPFISDLVNLKVDPTQVSSSIKNAVICQNGVLANQFRYISDMRRDKKKVLILGAGYVTPPVVDYLASQGHEISLVSALENEAQNLISKHNFNATGYTFDCVGDQAQLGSMIGDHDLVISLLPYTFHPMVAKLAIEKKVNMVTASYLSPGMEELDSAAKSSGITVVNEVGVDPGIDHMLAMELFHELQESGEEIKSFVSFCGGLPAPEASNNPLGYKFSWSPRGVLLNTVSGAQWLHSNKTDGIAPGGDIICKPYQFDGRDSEVKFSTWKGFSLEGLPNRDSTKYREPYNIPKCETLLRGTFRYSGYCSILRDFHALNLITEEANANMAKCNTWEEFIAMQVGAEGKTGAALKKHLAGMKNKNGENIHVDQLEELGVLSSAPIKQTACPLDSLAALLDQNCQYLKGERDAILMRHEVTTHQNPNTVHGVDFVYYGDQGNKSTSEYSAMAQTVGYPCAIAAHLVLEGHIAQPGMVTPLAKEIYKPILSELEKLGITARRTKSTQY